MKTIQVLGTGCPKCAKLAENAKAAAESLGIEYEIQKITDMGAIMAAGVMMTPALRVNGTVILSGSSGSPDEIRKLIQ